MKNFTIQQSILADCGLVLLRRFGRLLPEGADRRPACAPRSSDRRAGGYGRTKSETDVAYASASWRGRHRPLRRNPLDADAGLSGRFGQLYSERQIVRQADGSWREEGSKSYYMEQGQVMDLYAYYPYAENADPTALVYDTLRLPKPTS